MHQVQGDETKETSEKMGDSPVVFLPFPYPWIYQKLKLPELVTTKMTLELANVSLAIPTGIAEDVLVKYGEEQVDEGMDFEKMDSDSDKTKDFDKSSSNVFKSLSDEFEPGGSSYVEGNDLICYEDFHVSDVLFSTSMEINLSYPDP
ncbi:hypothetical protein Tco_0010594 [Tanacetum coccineum]